MRFQKKKKKKCGSALYVFNKLEILLSRQSVITSGSCVAVADRVRRRFEVDSVPTTAGSSAPRSAGLGPSSRQQGGRWERTAAVVAPPAAAGAAAAACRDPATHAPWGSSCCASLRLQADRVISFQLTAETAFLFFPVVCFFFFFSF